MPKVTTIEIKNDKNGNPMKITTFDGGQKVFVNSKWDEAIYNKVVENAEFELIQDGAFTKVKYDKPVANGAGFAPNKGGFGGGVAKAQERKAEMIEKAQDRKNESIAFFNATNCAIAIVDKNAGEAKLKVEIVEWRNWFLEQWQKYEAGSFTDKHQPF